MAICCYNFSWFTVPIDGNYNDVVSVDGDGYIIANRAGITKIYAGYLTGSIALFSNRCDITVEDKNIVLTGDVTSPVTVPDGYTLILNGAAIKCSGAEDKPEIKLEGNAIIKIADDTENNISVGGTSVSVLYDPIDGYDSNQVLIIRGGEKGNGKLTIIGDSGIDVNKIKVEGGVLNVIGTGNGGIFCQDGLTVNGGTLTVEGAEFSIACKISLANGYVLYAGDSSDSTNPVSPDEDNLYYCDGMYAVITPRTHSPGLGG